MQTKQPDWKLVAQLGDVHPIDHGGYFVYEDTTGVYPPEVAVLVPPVSDKGSWIEYRFVLEPCTWINGILSDNKFHPEHPAWFAKEIGSVSNCVGIPLAELIDMFTNGNTVSKARAWEAIGDYFGFENLDSYPNKFSRKEIESRYPRETWRV